jgi:hypothetical protein
VSQQSLNFVIACDTSNSPYMSLKISNSSNTQTTMYVQILTTLKVTDKLLPKVVSYRDDNLSTNVDSVAAVLLEYAYYDAAIWQ